MKKLKLDPKAFGNVEVLSREQLKNVLGGLDGSGSGGVGCTPPGGMCNAHSECCQPTGTGHVNICLVNTYNGYAYCRNW